MIQNVVNRFFGISKQVNTVSSVGELSRFEYPLTSISSQNFYDILPVVAGEMYCFGHFVVRINKFFLVIINHIFVE